MKLSEHLPTTLGEPADQNAGFVGLFGYFLSPCKITFQGSCDICLIHLPVVCEVLLM